MHSCSEAQNRDSRTCTNRAVFLVYSFCAEDENSSNEIGHGEKRHIVSPSSVSSWASPVVLVPKKDGTTQFCVDFRRLNTITKKDVYPLPRIEDILDTLGRAQYFTRFVGWVLADSARSVCKGEDSFHYTLWNF